MWYNKKELNMKPNLCDAVTIYNEERAEQEVEERLFKFHFMANESAKFITRRSKEAATKETGGEDISLGHPCPGSFGISENYFSF